MNPNELPASRPVREAVSFIRLCICCVLTQGCRPHTEPLRVEWFTMGTVAAVQCADHATASAARDIAQAAFDTIDKELSNWKSDTALAAVNRAAGTDAPVPVPPDLDIVLRFALGMSAESDGAFNPLVGPVMHAWGFNGASPRSSLPDAAELRADAALADWRAVQFATVTNTPAVRLPVAGMQLDLGAIAKGYAVDCAWDRLRAAGHTNILVDLGGNLRAIGEASAGRGGWRTGVRNPFDKADLIGMFLMRDGEAVATSGNYERFVEINGIRYAHIMDPRTGTPITGMAGTTVIAPNAMLADALSTTLFILGPERGSILLRSHPGCEALWIPDTPDKLTVIATPGMASRLEPIGQTAFTISVVTAKPNP